MTLRDLLKKKEKIKDEGDSQPAQKASSGPTLSPDVPEFTFMRTTTTTQEMIQPPSHPDDPTREQPLLSPEPHKRPGRFRRHSNTSQAAPGAEDTRGKGEHRLSERLHFGRARSSSSVNVPDVLPEVGEGVARSEEEEAKWEKRATVLATTLNKSASTTPNTELPDPMAGSGRRSRSKSVVDAGGDVR